MKLLANKEIEQIVDSVCDNALSSLNQGSDGLLDGPFAAEFLKTFEGPIPGQLFIDCGNKVRLALSFTSTSSTPTEYRLILTQTPLALSHWRS